MRYIHTIIGFWAIAFFSCLNHIACAQDIKPSVSNSSIRPFKSGTYNFDHFTLQYKTPTPEWKLHNKESLNHPDAGYITRDNPANAIEVLAKRTYNSRYFVDKDTAAKFYMVQATTDINYWKDGQWLTIDKRVAPQQKDKYEASRQPEPVGFDPANKLSYIKTFSGSVYFNNWQLIGQNGDSSTPLAIADWSHFTVGDDGIKITDVFPGIDAEMIADKGSIKTNFIVKQNAFKGYEQLIFTDAFKGDKAGGKLVFSDQDEAPGGVDFMVDKKPLVHINRALMYVENKPASTFETIKYKIDNNRLSLWVNGNDLTNKLAIGTVLIDPQVTSADSLPLASIGGSMNDGNINLSCNYNLVMNTPAKGTITDIAFQFGFNTYAPANNSMGKIAIGLGACNTGSIGADSTGNDTGYLKPGYASTMGQWAPIDDLVGCQPTPTCAPQPITFVLQFYNTAPFGPNGVCSDEYVGPHEAFQILISGYTLQMDSTVLQNGVSSPTAICRTDSSVLSAQGINGVPPYTYVWDHGAGNGNSVTVSPAATTNYTVTITDQCGNTVNASTLITVLPQLTPSITILSPVTTTCDGTPVTFSAVATNGGASPFYQWELNGNDVGTNSSTYTNNTWTNGDQISCVVVSDATCVFPVAAVSNTITMNVPAPATPSVSIAASANDVCGDIPITFSAVAVEVGPTPFYQWQVNGINVGSNDSLYTSDSLANADMVSCVVSVSNTGCYTSPTAISNPLAMEIKPIPAIALSASKMVLRVGDTTQLTAVITGGYSSFVWTPTTGLIDPSVLAPIANPLLSTTYSIDVTDTNGCVQSDSILIGVYDPIIMPNAFTPNSSLNNVFRIPPTITLNLTSLSVYNRWGQMIFQTSDISQGWDGTFEGNKCDIGTYIYIITGSNAKGPVFVKGYVSLFR